MFSKFNCSTVKWGEKELYVLGNAELLQLPMLSVAGTRKPTTESCNWLKQLLGTVQNHVIVSGLALGTDSVAHKTAIENDLPTIAVLPSGFDNIAPRSNLSLALRILQSGGALVSEYPPETKVQKRQYIERNKIIASFGKCLIVPQCNYKSGTMHTVKFAEELQKTIVVQKANYTGNIYIRDSYPYVKML